MGLLRARPADGWRPHLRALGGPQPLRTQPAKLRLLNGRPTIEEGEERSLRLLHRCRTAGGFVASADLDHYRAVWARDACIAALGALVTPDPELWRTAGDTLDTLAATTSPTGVVPAVVSTDRRRWDWGEGGVVDASAWFCILAARHFQVTRQTDRAKSWWPAVRAAISFLRHQDVTGSGLISVAPSTDWMDAALTRSGRTLHLNVLYAWAASSARSLAASLGEEVEIDPAVIGQAVETWFWPSPEIDAAALYPHGFAHDALRVSYWQAASYPRRHYLSHIVHSAFVDHCDVLANLLAIVAGIAGERAGIVLDHLREAANPVPSRTFLEAIEPGDPSGMLVLQAEAAIPPRWRNRPGRYHNGAAWPYIGGFHALAAVMAGRREEAGDLLERVAAANALGEWSFPEWVDDAGEPAGARHQAWNAGTFLLASAAIGGRASPEG